jgi:GDP-L-fucose synthase
VKVCVTGGNGFLGTFVCNELLNRSVDVVSLGRKQGDLANPLVAENAFKDANVVVHLAADVGGVGYLRERAGRSFHFNLQLGLNVVRAVQRTQVKRIVMAGTPCAYSGDAALPLTEDMLVEGVPSGDTGYYGFAKLVSSLVANHFCLPCGIDVATVIPSNLYGPGDNFDSDRGHVVAALIRKALIARELGHPTFSVWGDGSATRDFVFVRDVASAIADVVVRPENHHGATYNLGSGIETSIKSIAHEVAQAVDKSIQPRFETDKPVGYTRRVMSIEHARAELGYAPTTALRAGLTETVDWLWSTGTVKQWLDKGRRDAA